MIILGLAGPARAGKDTVADYLVKQYNFVKFAFSDALYQEVQEAFGLEDQSLLRGAGKDTPAEALDLNNCGDDKFYALAYPLLHLERYPSPRQILQWWGTEYRRAQYPNYWIKKAAYRIGCMQQIRYPEQRPQHFVECGTRFDNERRWITGSDRQYDNEGGRGEFSNERYGNIWHIRRDTGAVASAHSSAKPLLVLPGERELWNNGTIEWLHQGIDLLMATAAQFVRVEPMVPYDGVANRAQYEAEAAHAEQESYDVPWCCEKAQALGIPVCPDCAAISACYSETMSPKEPK